MWNKTEERPYPKTEDCEGYPLSTLYDRRERLISYNSSSYLTSTLHLLGTYQEACIHLDCLLSEYLIWQEGMEVPRKGTEPP